MDRRAFALALTCLAPLPACDMSADPPPVGDVGVVELALTVDEATLGGDWRLSGGEFSITDTTHEVDSIPATGGQRVVRRQLAPGEYTASLGGDWILQRFVNGQAFDVDAELVETAPIAFTITSGEAALVRFQFKTQKKGTVAIAMDVADAPVVTAFVHFDSVAEPASDPWMAPLLHADALLTWSMDQVSAHKSTLGAANVTDIVATKHHLELDPGAPQILADLLAANGTPGPILGAFDPTLRLLGNAIGGYLERFEDRWGYNGLECAFRLLPTPEPTMPPGHDGFPVLVPVDMPDGVVELECLDAQGALLYQARGTVAWDIQ